MATARPARANAAISRSRAVAAVGAACAGVRVTDRPSSLSTKRISCPLVLRDASLVYRVLRLVNSPMYAIYDPITSLEKAILILGDVAFRRIATLATWVLGNRCRQ